MSAKIENIERINVNLVNLYSQLLQLRNDETIISSISVTDIVFDVYLGKWNYRAIPKVKTWSYFLIIPKEMKTNRNMIPEHL